MSAILSSFSTWNIISYRNTNYLQLFRFTHMINWCILIYTNCTIHFWHKAPYQDLSHCHYFSLNLGWRLNMTHCRFSDVCVTDHFVLCSRIHLDLVQQSVKKEAFGNQTSVEVLMPNDSSTGLHYYLCCIILMEIKCK
jgi:hypothetical protein